MISKADLGELQRLATNFYDDDKKFVRRIIHQVSLMDREALGKPRASSFFLPNKFYFFQKFKS